MYPFMPWWDFWHSFAPSIPVPSIYWNVRSPEQRILEMCKNMGVIFEYLAATGKQVAEMQETIDQIIDGHIDPIIEQAIADWFAENEPEIVSDITDLQERMTESENRLDYLFDRVGFCKTIPSFRCIARFIDTWPKTGARSAQAGCVFTQNGYKYWAQILNSSVANEDMLVIVEVNTNTVISHKALELGHGYSLSYNPTTKQLLTQNSDVTPRELIIINVSNLNDPYIERTFSVPVGIYIDNPCWYDETRFAGFNSSSHSMVVYEMDFTVVKTFSTDYDEQFPAIIGQGFTFQNVQRVNYLDEWYWIIGVTGGDGIIINREAENSIDMIGYIPAQQYYSFIYMRELEFAYIDGSKMYINSYDQIDDFMVTSLLEWDMETGTSAAENSPRIQYDTGNVSYTVDYDNGSLLPVPGITFKLFGDVINWHRSFSGNTYAYIFMKSDYPSIIYTNGTKVILIKHADAASVTIDGIKCYASDLVLFGSDIKIRPRNTETVDGVTRGISIEATYSHIIVRNWPSINNTVDPVTNPLLMFAQYCTIDAASAAGTSPDVNYFRYSTVIYNTIARLNLEHYGMCAMIGATTGP